jgi:multiple sugar transport system substrate-binding protein
VNLDPKACNSRLVLATASCLPLLAVALLAGCRPAQNPAATPSQSGNSQSAPAESAKSLPLTLLVADDPGLAAAIHRRRGEWQARSQGELEVVEVKLLDLVGAEPPKGDLVIYPPRYTGELLAKKAIVPFRKAFLEKESYRAADVFHLVWQYEASWGRDGQIIALPLGSPLLTIAARADLFEHINEQPPVTWEDYERVAKKLAELADGAAESGGTAKHWYGAVEPLADGFRWWTLLARAAPYARSPNYYSALFDVESFEPLIAGPPFVRALEELRAAANLNCRADGSLVMVDPATAWRMLQGGECGLALTWPTAADGQERAHENRALLFAELPGSRNVFDIGNRAWQPRAAGDSGRVPLVGGAGRVVSIVGTTRNVPSAQRLAAWLSGPEMSSQVSKASPAVTLFSTRHLANPAPWAAAHIEAAAARQLAEVTQQALAREIGLAVPRIPGIDEYLQALDDAVADALSGKAPCAAALTAAAERWRAITERRGRDAQLAAYRASLRL